MATRLRVTSSHGHEPPSQAAQIALLMRYTLTVHSTSKSKPRLLWPWELVTRRLTAMAGRGLTELQGVTIDFWGGPQLHLWPQPARPL